MNNFQLNNTSVYLGGQCQWDLILKSQDGTFIADGFQLTPISNNVSFNKKSDINHLNNNHSDTLKKFASELEENFWSTTQTEYIYNLGKNIISYDQSFNSGVKRLPSFDVYKKQFSFFIPLWLEYIKNENCYLKFRLSAFLYDNHNTPLGTKDFDLKLYDGDNFHNKFVNYFNNWLTYLNIIPNPNRYGEDNLGNDRVMNIDMENSSVSISGISTNSGQIINEINCDYVSYDLLNFERPNIETDYILSSLFKAHNVIASQLFNFNLCFDLDDIISPIFINQLWGKKINIACDVFIIDGEEETQLEKRSLYTNYKFISKNSYNPFIFLLDVDGNGEEKYEIESNNSENMNVLDFLMDYDNAVIENKNKLTQPIYHWGYVNHGEKSFNLYDGYKYKYYEFGPQVTREINNNGYPVYKYDNYEIPYTNGISIPYLQNKYIGGHGELTWLYPSKSIYVGYDGASVGYIMTKIITDLMLKGPSGLLYQNCINIEKCNKQWNTHIDDTDDPKFKGISCVYLCVGDTFNVYSSISNIYGEENVYILKDINGNDISSDVTIVSDSGVAVIYTKNMNYLMLNNILNMRCDDHSDDMEYILKIAEGIKSSITTGNDGNFYGFDTEICVGKNEINQNVYYKLDSKSTYVYRNDGKLSPLMIDDNKYNLNYDYYLRIYDKSIHTMSEINDINVPEICKYGDSWVLNLLSQLNFTITKDLNDDTSLKDLIKKQLETIYKTNDDSELTDYIYNLYNVKFDYEFVENRNQHTSIIYKVKSILI